MYAITTRPGTNNAVHVAVAVNHNGRPSLVRFACHHAVKDNMEVAQYTDNRQAVMGMATAIAIEEDRWVCKNCAKVLDRVNASDKKTNSPASTTPTKNDPVKATPAKEFKYTTPPRYTLTVLNANTRPTGESHSLNDRRLILGIAERFDYYMITDNRTKRVIRDRIAP